MSTTFSPRRILVGISCEASTKGIGIARADRHAFQQAAWLAQRTGAAIRAFHVTDFLDEQLTHGRDRVAEIIRDSLTSQLDGMCGKAAVSRVSTSYGFASGKPWMELLREAHRWEADVMVITPRRADIDIASRVIHGSTARRIIRKAQTPVWVVHPGPSVAIENVLACVDGSPVSKRVLSAAHAVADIGDA
jgi:nucleotide-binding universal stress UspA family protein